MGRTLKSSTLEGVAGKATVITGHPLHDAAFRRLNQVRMDRISSTCAPRMDSPWTSALFCTRRSRSSGGGAITPEELRENIEAMNVAVSALGSDYRLTVKIHPRESVDDYAFCAELQPAVWVIPDAEMTDLIALADISFHRPRPPCYWQ